MAVLFDASAGDYWVLTPAGRAAVDILSTEGPLAQEDLIPRLACAADDAITLLHDLARSGIISGSALGAPVDVEPAVDPLD